MQNASSAFLRILLLLLPLSVLPAGAQAASASYDRGVTAFQAGRYQDALAAFRQAEQEGNHSVQLHYNLAVTYFRLGEYGKARAIFEEIATHPDQAAVAHYNLGLIALKTGDNETARAEFVSVKNGSGNGSLRKLATAQLARLSGDAADAEKPSRLSGFMSIGAGYDSNVALALETGLVSASRQDAPLASLLLGGTAQLSGDRDTGWQLTGSYYGVSYPGLSQYDLDYVRLGPQYRYTAGRWSTEAGVSGAYLALAGAALETIGTFRLQESRKIGHGNELALEYRYDQVKGDVAYDSLSGWRQSLKLEDAYTPGAFSVTGGCRLELNDRNDLSRPPEFRSTSPTRIRPYLTLGWKFSDRTQARLAYEYERSAYNDTDLVMQGLVLTSIDRVDERNTATFTLAHRVGRKWTLAGEYRYLDNSSTLAVDTYTSERYVLRLDHTVP